MKHTDADIPQASAYFSDPDDPLNYMPKSDGGFGVGLLAGILFGMPFGFHGASIGAFLGGLVGVFVDQERHALHVARERCRIRWQGHDDW